MRLLILFPFAVYSSVTPLADIIVREECPLLNSSELAVFVEFESTMLLSGLTRDAVSGLVGLKSFLSHRWLNHSLCHDWISKHVLKLAEWTTSPERARLLINLANLFKLVGIRNWYRLILADFDERGISLDGRRAPHSRLYAEISRSQAKFFDRFSLNRTMAAPEMCIPKNAQIFVHSICIYPKGSQLPLLAASNHKQYTNRHNYMYSMTEEVGSEYLENPQFFKTKFLIDWTQTHSKNQWVFLIDCDAFFTNMDIPISSLIANAKEDTWMVVAEDSSGINTGVLLVRGENADFFKAVTKHVHMAMSWDQSMVFYELLLRSNMLEENMPVLYPPAGVMLVHQANLNAFHEGSAKSWGTYAWQAGDFVKHFAGCPQEEVYCLDLMRQTVMNTT